MDGIQTSGGLARRAEFEKVLRRAGIGEEKPLHAILVATHEAAETAREVAGGARGLTPDGEAALITRVTEACSRAAVTETRRLARHVAVWTWVKVGLASLMFALVVAGLTYWAMDSRMRAREAALVQGCTGAAVKVIDGRRACGVWLWLDGTGARQ